MRGRTRRSYDVFPRLVPTPRVTPENALRALQDATRLEIEAGLRDSELTQSDIQDLIHVLANYSNGQ